jgi:hypothetical protein
MHKLRKILAALRRMPSPTNSANCYIKSLERTLTVRYLFKEKPFLVLRCTSKNH